MLHHHSVLRDVSVPPAVVEVVNRPAVHACNMINHDGKYHKFLFVTLKPFLGLIDLLTFDKCSILNVSFNKHLFVVYPSDF